MTRTLGVGIIGAGNIAGVYLRLAPLFDTFVIRAIADLNRETADRRAAEFGISSMSVDDLLADPGIDVVVNLTIPAAHFAVARRILLAGKHAYSEKPLVLDLDEGRELERIAQARGLTVCAAPDTFMGSAHQQARALIDAGRLGTVTSGTMHVMGPGMEHWHPDPRFFFQPGGGPVLDMGPYYVTALINLLGPVSRVTAMANRGRAERIVTTPGSDLAGTAIAVEIPTTIHAVLEFETGALITFGASWDVMGHGHPAIELYGTEASLLVPDPNFFGGQLVLGGRDGHREPLAPWDHPFGIENTDLDKPVPRANYRCAGLSDMVDAIATGRPARCAITVALHAVDVLLSILRAAETGRTESLATRCERPAPLPPQAARALLRA